MRHQMNKQQNPKTSCFSFAPNCGAGAMELIEGSSGEHNQHEELISLICGLSDDVAILCLAMVPRRYHHVLRCVSRRWRTVIGSEEWQACRRNNNLEETWIYVMCRAILNDGSRFFVLDPHHERQCWEPIPAVPPQCLKNKGMSFNALGKKLYLMGGCSCQKDAMDEVYCYDACTNQWEMSAPMPTPRYNFSSVTLNNKLYITGGVKTDRAAQSSWDIYDSDSDSWTSGSDPTMNVPGICKLIALDGRIYTVHKTWNGPHCTGAYDPVSGTWEPSDQEISLCYRGPTFVVDGTLYMLDLTEGTKLMMWRRENKEWVLMVQFPHHPYRRMPCRVASIGRRIFLIDHVLSVMVIDVDKATKVDGTLLSTCLVPKFTPDLMVTGCTTITL